MKTNTLKIENWEEDFDKKFKVSYNYEHIKTKLFTPEERLLWSVFGNRNEKKPEYAVKDFITQEIAKAKEEERNRIIDIIDELSFNLDHTSTCYQLNKILTDKTL